MHLRVYLKDLRLRAYHGVHEKERSAGASFSITLCCTLSEHAAGYENDSLADTVDYEALCDLVRAVMQEPKCLIEHVAYRLARRVLYTYPIVEAVEVALTKEIGDGLPKIAGCSLRLSQADCAPS